MSGYAARGNLDLWYARLDVEDLMAGAELIATSKERKRAEQNVAKTPTKDQPQGVCEADRDRRRRAAHHR